jgi:hypothetical protein
MLRCEFLSTSCRVSPTAINAGTAADYPGLTLPNWLACRQFKHGRKIAPFAQPQQWTTLWGAALPIDPGNQFSMRTARFFSKTGHVEFSPAPERSI